MPNGRIPSFRVPRWSLGASLLVLLLFGSSALHGQSRIQADFNRAYAAGRALEAALQTGTPDFYYMRAQLNMQDYDSLEAIFHDAMNRYEKDVAYEHYLLRGYELFSPDNRVLLENLDHWVETTGSAIAYAARGVFKAQVGYEARGRLGLSETSQEQLMAMLSFHLDATGDLLSALERDPRLIPAYVHLIKIAMYSPVPSAPTEILFEALHHDPRSYYVRQQYLEAVKPRWGGTFDDMYAYALEFAGHSDVNPRLYSLLGEISGEGGELAWMQKDYRQAEIYYTRALEFGDRVTWLKARAGCYYNLGEYEKAIDDLLTVLQYTPSDQTALEWVAYSQAQLEDGE
jgi:hypothetical protein